MTSKIVVNNIESDSGISSVTVVSNIAGQDSTQNISGINSVTAISFHGNLTGNVTGSGANLTNIPTVSDINNLINNVAILGFKVATNGSLAKYSLVNQVIDEFNDSSGIDASASTNENLVDGYFRGATGSYPTGGTITDYGVYKVHSFLSSGTWTSPSSGTVDVLIVAGGGGGGSGRGGGGGAGGMLYRTGLSVTNQAYTITVGNGGDGSTHHISDASENGQDSVAFSVTAKGGGAGGSGVIADAGVSIGKAGGSSGGTTHGADGAVASNQGTFSGWTAKGNAGGNGNGSDNESAGGGGGAGAAGQAGDASGNGGDGGIGFQNDYRTGVNQYYAGGGGAGFGHDSGATSGAGGTGGGGSGPPGSALTATGDATAGTPNTGGGGGGGVYSAGGGSGFTPTNTHGQAGGSGIVVIRYNRNTQFLSIGDLTLQSVDTTAVDGAPTKADLIMLMENAAGTATLNTDIKGFISRDSGTTFTQGTLVDEGSYGTSTKRIVAFHDLDISGQPSGTSICYKITTHNQSASKSTRIHAVSHGWK